MPLNPSLTRRSLLAAAGGGLAASFALPRAARAVELDITDGNIQPIPVAIPAFGGDPQVASAIAGVVAADLTRSGLFVVLNPATYGGRTAPLEAVPDLAGWKATSAQALVSASAGPAGDGRVQASFRLWDIVAGRALAGQQFAAPQADWRRVAHKIADVIYARMTGEKGYFDSRVVYVDETGPKTQRVRRLAMMDQDGANSRYITRGTEMVDTPRFSPAGQVIAYMAFGATNPKVYIANLATGQRTAVGNFQGLSLAPRFSPDGSRLLMSLGQNGISNIYLTDLSGGQAVRLTDGTSIDTSPCFSPDGRSVAFESDRSGSQQIYITSASGGGAQRITFGGGSYATPAWSPRGDLIAFTRIGGGGFSIGVMKPDGSALRILTEGYHNEGPAWSPNGRVIMFYRDLGAGPKIFTIDVSGRNEQQIPTPSYASGPAWGPLLP